ncbi:MAG: arylsulfotransferase family protein [Acidimicrobiales bacterium]
MDEQRGDNDPRVQLGTLGSRHLTRRQLMTGGLGALGALGIGGLIGYEWPHQSAPHPAQDVDGPALSEVRLFVSRPDLRPPAVRVTTHFGERAAYRKASRSEYFFLSPRHLTPAPSQPGLMIIDSFGRLVWFHPVVDAPFDLKHQSYNGRPALSWFEGRVTSGYGIGVGKIANASYEIERVIHAGDGLEEDLHELVLTSRGSAYITAYQQVRMDMTAQGGASDAKVLVGHVQEIDLATGKVLFDWDSRSHVATKESYVHPPSNGDIAYDYFHINSVSETPDGNLLVSARNTWALYKVDRDSGKVLWRLNGKRSDFAMGPGSRFFWQHDASMVGERTISLFDDGDSPAEETQSRALLLGLDTNTKTASLEHAYLYPARFLSANQGSMQVLPDRRVVVGWGNQPYFSEYAPDGSLLIDGELPEAVRSYRAYVGTWTGDPISPPSVSVHPNPAGGALVYASWNGSTKVVAWKVLSGPHPGSLVPAGVQAWSGFETAIATMPPGPYYAVTALDAAGRELGRSKTVKLS